MKINISLWAGRQAQHLGIDIIKPKDLALFVAIGFSVVLYCNCISFY